MRRHLEVGQPFDLKPLERLLGIARK